MAVNKKITKGGVVKFVADFREGGRRGKRYRKEFATEAEAIKWEKIKLAEVAKGEFIAPSSDTVSQVAERWLERKKAQKKKDGTCVYKNSSLNFWKYHIDKFIKPCSLGAMKITAANDVILIEKTAPEWGMSSYSTGKIFTTLSAIFNLARRERLISDNCVALVERPKIATEDDDDGIVLEDEVYSKEEVQKIIEATAPGSFDRALIMTLALTGMRIGEVLGLCWEYVDLKERKISVRQSLGVGTKAEPLQLQFVKSRAGRRTLPNLPAAYIRELTTWKLKCPPSKPGYVFCGAAGNPKYRSVTRKIIRSAAKTAEVTARGTHHVFRHTFASHLLMAGVSDVEVAYLLGHEDTTITRKIYTHFIRDSKSNTLSALAASIMGE